MPTRDAGARTDRRDLDEYLSAQSQVPVQPPCVGIEVIQGGDEDSDDERWDRITTIATERTFHETVLPISLGLRPSRRPKHSRNLRWT